MANRLNPLFISRRFVHFKFSRTLLPPLQEPRESPYIVGPYLKPSYEPVKYITEPIKARDDNDLNHFIYEFERIESEENRTVSLLLIQDVEGLGVAGQVVEGPSILVAMRRAEYATEHAFKWYKSGPRTAESASSALSPRTARFLKTRVFNLPVSQNFDLNDLEPWHLSVALRLSNCVCPTSAIGSIEADVDEAQVKCIVTINNHEKVEVRFKVDFVVK